MVQVYEQSDYKSLIRAGVRQMKESQAGFTLRKLSQQIPVQYTYLSKVLNDDSAHLSEDHLFRVAQLLKFDAQETEYLLLLKSLATTQDSDRREYLKIKLETLQKEKALDAERRQSIESRLSEEMKYLLDPLCIIVHLALHIPQFAKAPVALCSHLRVSEERLRKILLILEFNGFVETQREDPFKIRQVHSGHLHYGKEHPLMRTHQNLMKSAIPPKLQQIEEQDKQSFLATFTLDPADFEKIRVEFNAFIKKVEGVVKNSPQTGVYQLNFDFFRWI